MRTCRTCRTAKPLSEFGRDKRSSDGIMLVCKLCTQEKNKASYERNIEKRRAYARVVSAENRGAKSDYNRLYREKNRETLIEQSRAWRAAGNKANRSEQSKERSKARSNMMYATDPTYRERAKAYAVLYRRKNPEKKLAQDKLWRANNLDHARKYARDYYREFNQTPEGKARQAASRIKHRAKRQVRRTHYYASRYGTAGEITNQHLNWLHKWQDHRCCYCNAYLDGKETIEHVVPLNRGGENNPHNVLLACSGCNASKQDRLFDESEWQPRLVHPHEQIHSRYCTDIAVKLCRNAGIVVEEQNGMLVFQGGHALSVLSTFWLSDRSETEITVQALHDALPRTLLTFDYEWMERPEAMLNVVQAKIGTALSIGARELELASPTIDEARAFMNRWHVQGFAGGSWYIGLRLPGTDDWRGMASFRRNGTAYELARLAFNGHVSGGLSRIIHAFTGAMPVQGDLLTYADTRFGKGNGYLRGGFEPQGETVPWYCYVNGAGLHSRQAYRKDSMATELDWFDPEWSEHRLARTNGLWRLTGLPQRRFILPKT